MNSPWTLAEREYPRRAGVTEQLCHLVRYAVLAPSSHNTQPWRFVLHRERLSLRADRTRRLPVVDPADRELVISCGAALGHLEIAARHFGREPWVKLLPDPDDPDRLADIALGPSRKPRPEDTQLFSGILQRRTTREAYSALPVPTNVVDDLVRLGRDRGVDVRTVVERGMRERMAALVADGDRRQFADPAFRAELAAWIRSRRSGRRDGLSAEGFDVPDSLSGIGALVVRTFDIGRGVAARDIEIAAGSPLLVLLSSAGDAPDDWLRTGRALSAILLRAVASDVTASYLNQPIEVPALRESLARVADVVGHPQLLLRFGYSEHSLPAPRRSLEEVLEIAQPSVAPSSAPGA